MGPQMGAMYPDQAYYEQMGKHFKEAKAKFQRDPFFSSEVQSANKLSFYSKN